MNNNNSIEPLDALLVINYLNAGFSTDIPPAAATGGGPGFLDTTGDDEVAPLDALLVINALNAGLGGEGEAESDSASPSNDFADLIALLVSDAAEQTTRRRRRS